MNARANTTIGKRCMPRPGSLLSIPNMDPERRARACQGALVPILSGIAAIGDWLTQDDEQNEMLDTSLANTGYLLTFLAELAIDLHNIEVDAMASSETHA